MTPDEKALRLCQKIAGVTLFAPDCNEGYTLPKRVAKEIATILVNEILATSASNVNHEKFYWLRVKEEIEKL